MPYAVNYEKYLQNHLQNQPEIFSSYYLIYLKEKSMIFESFPDLETTSVSAFPKTSAKKNAPIFFKFCWKSNAFM